MGLRISTHFLPPEQYGVLALLLAVQMFFALIIINPVGQHITLNTHAWWDNRTLLPRLKTYRYFILVISFFGGIAAIFVSPSGEISSYFISFLAVSCFILASTWNNTLVFILNMLGFRLEMAVWSVISVCISVGFGSCMLFWHPTATFWMLGQSIGLFFGFLGARASMLRHAKPIKVIKNKQSLIDRKTLISYCLPVAFANGFMWLQLNGYRFEINYYWGLEQLGYLAVGIQITTQIGVLAESLAIQFLYPMFYRRCNDSQKVIEISDAISDLMNTLAPLYLTLIGAIVAGAPYLLSVMVATNYREAAIYLQIGAIIELCRIMSNLLGVSPHIMRQTKYLAVPYIMGASCSFLLLGGAGFLKLPILFSAIALALGFIVMLIGMSINVLRQIDLKFDLVRLTCGFVLMFLLPIFFYFIRMPEGIINSIEALLLIGLLSGISFISLVYRNPSTLRILSVKI